MRTPIVRAAALLAVLMTAVLAVGLAALAPVAGAHGDDGVLTLVSATTSGSSSTVTVKLTYEGDGHPVDGATVTVVADDGAGQSVDPVPMEAGTSSGEYTATVQLPSTGTWNLRVTAVNPAATITTTQVVTGSEAPGGTEPEMTVGTEPEQTATPTTEDPALDAEITESPTSTSAEDDDDSSTLPWLGGAVVLLGLVAVAVVAVVRGRRLEVEAPPGSELPKDEGPPTDGQRGPNES